MNYSTKFNGDTDYIKQIKPRLMKCLNLSADNDVTNPTDKNCVRNCSFACIVTRSYFDKSITFAQIFEIFWYIPVHIENLSYFSI